LCGRHLSFQGDRFSDKALMTDKSLVACLGGTLVKKAFKGSALIKKTLSCASSILAGGFLLASMSGMLVEEPLTVGSLFLAGASGLRDEECHMLASMSSVLVEEPLVVGSLFLVGASSLLDEECLVLIRPQIVDGRLPIPVGAVCASVSPMKNGPPSCLGSSNPAACWSSRMAC
jgi:hypothetical protein